MKKLLITTWCICLAIAGYYTTNGVNVLSEVHLKQNSLNAATVPSWNYNGPMPLDLQLSAAQRIKSDTVVIHDTVTVNNTKYIRVPVPTCTTDTIYVPMEDLPEVEVVAVKNKNPGDREEHTLDDMPNTKSGIVLIVDGNTVYTSKTDIHSGNESDATHTSVSDEH